MIGYVYADGLVDREKLMIQDGAEIAGTIFSSRGE